METLTIPRTDRHVGALLWTAACPQDGEPVTVHCPDDALDALGFTRRGVEKALRRLEACGAIVWVRKRPGTPRVSYTTVVVDPRCPRWVELGVAA
jgi:hypothetical protein